MFFNILYILQNTLYCIIFIPVLTQKSMKRKRRKRKKVLTLLKEVDSVKVCNDENKQKVFLLPKAMTGEDFTGFKIDNRNYLRKLKNK